MFEGTNAGASSWATDSLGEVLRSLFAGLPTDALTLTSGPVANLPAPIRSFTRAATLTVAILPRYGYAPTLRSWLGVGVRMGVKAPRTNLNPLEIGWAEA